LLLFLSGRMLGLMGKGNDPNCSAAEAMCSPLDAELPDRREDAPVRWFHGTTPGKAARILREGLRTPYEVFLTTFENEARSYGSDVVQVSASFRNPLIVSTSDGPIPKQFEALGLPWEPRGGYLSPNMVAALRARGYDAFIIDYPEDLRDPSDPRPPRRIARVLDSGSLNVLGESPLPPAPPHLDGRPVSRLALSPGPLPSDFAVGPPGSAREVARLDGHNGWRYREGFAYGPDAGWVPHAWLVDQHEAVIDPSWPHADERFAYIATPGEDPFAPAP